MKTVFVVLHYCQAEVTDECVSSLLSLNGEKNIVVVDNASPDDSGKVLQEKYASNEQVNVILNSENLGFAGGNNVGYRFAKDNLYPDVIIVLNNDTLIKDDSFLKKLCNLDLLSTHHIIGPDILSFKGKHQNPYREKGRGINQVKKVYRRKRLGVIFYKIPLLYKLKTIREEINSEQRENVMDRKEGIVPHGAAIIYTSNWIKEEDFAFYPGTFMYCEEDLLYYYSISKKYKIAYEPSLQIIHLEDMSTNFSHNKTREKMLFQNRQKARSLKVILEFMKANENNGV